jgi:hypothetical protein
MPSPAFQLLARNLATYPYVRAFDLLAGAGTTITWAPTSVTIGTGGGGGVTWTQVDSTSNPVTLVPGNGYICKGLLPVVFILPASSAQGDVYKIAGYSNLWQVTQNALQSINEGNQTSTPGIFGSIAATQIRDCVEMLCVTANTEFQLIDSTGNITFI